MNMISTGAFQSEMNASNNQPTLAEKFAAVWEKKNAKAARAGGVSLMALSLAACGSDDATTTTSSDTTSTTTTTTTAVSVNDKLTVGVDTLAGGAGADTFSGTAGNTNPTLTAGDTISGGEGSDMVLMVATGANAVNIAGVGLSSVETVRVADSTTGGNTTVNLAGQTGITDLESFGSAQTGNTNFSNVSAIADLNLSNTSGGGTTTITYTAAAVAGTADVQNVHLSTAAQTGDVTIAGVETVAVTTDANSSVALAVSGASSVTINGGANTTSVDLDAAVNTSLTSVDASLSSGATTMTIDADLAGDGMTVTGGSGNDIIDSSAGALGITDTVNGGDGSDTLRVQSSAATYGSASIAVDKATITSIEVLELEADHNGAADTAFTIDMDLVEGVTSVVLDSNDTDGANTFDLDDLNVAQAGAISIQGVTGTANGTTLNLDMKDGSGATDAAVVTASVASGNTITIGDDNGNIESLTVNMNGAVDSALAIATTDFAGTTLGQGSLTVTGGASGKTMTITGGASNIVADTVDLSGVKSDTTMTMGSVNATVTGGTGDDDVTFGTTLTSGDSFDGGAGNDRIIIDPASSITQAPTITNVEEMEIGATGTVTLVMTNSVVPEIILQAQAAVTNVVTLTNAAGITNVLADSGAANSDDDFNGLTLSGTGYAGLADALTMTLVADTDTVDTGAMTLTGIEDLTISVTGSASDFDATIGTGITGSSLNNVTVTSSGYGASSDSTDIVLGAVNDGGSDTMLSFDASGANTGVSVTLADMTTGSTVTGSGFIDSIILTGSAANVIANGGAGADTLTAAAAGSTLNGGAGGDTLNGAAGADVISGGAGVDTIDGNAGADTISTGTGADTISRNGDGSTDGSDTITDFTVGAGGDVIDFQTSAVGGNVTNAAAFNIQANGDNAATQLVNGFTVIDNNDGTNVSATSLSLANVSTYLGDTDGAGANTDQITVDNTGTTDDAYIAVSDGTDTGIFLVQHNDGDGAIDADEIVLIATLSGVSDAGTLTAANFADFI
jgi:Ca2+-binding RTX toxin-like protein